MKSSIRSEILSSIRLMPIEKIDAASLAIQENLKSYLKSEVGFWGGYSSLSDEPKISWNKVSNQIEWSLPVALPDGNMKFVAGAEKFKKSEFGVSEPIDGSEVESTELRGVVAAAVAFDRKGYRLGRGKGFYDRYLSNFNGKKIGVCFASALQEALPAEAHDVKFDAVITEREILSF